MKILFDYLAILCFFIAFKLTNIYTATAVAMVVFSIQILACYIMHKRVEKSHLVSLVLLLLLGGSTLLLHKEIFIKWKPSIVYWIFSIVLIASHWIGEKPIIERLMGTGMALPKPVWYKLNMAWGCFFFAMGWLNLYVIYHYSTNVWVNFKLMGTLGLIIVFCIAQAFYLSRYIKDIDTDTKKSEC